MSVTTAVDGLLTECTCLGDVAPGICAPLSSVTTVNKAGSVLVRLRRVRITIIYAEDHVKPYIKSANKIKFLNAVKSGMYSNHCDLEAYEMECVCVK